MLFNSLDFAVFLPIVVLTYFVLPRRLRIFMLLIASYYFYMCWKAEYAVLILASTLVDYYAGLRMERIPDRAGRRKYLILSLFANLGLLFGFKYFNFFNESVRAVLQPFNVMYQVPYWDVLLPVGISFYTFQTLSYTIDLYRGERAAEKNFIVFATYVAFFPQLVAGPIERSKHLLPQFHERHAFDYKRMTDGLKLMAWGFFKKLVIADRLALYVNAVYNHPHDYQGFPIALATYFFAVQIYCDFSGYSDIAIGTAQLLGFRLMKNFDRPYFARSISDFWSRWHISLSTWFRDYVYIPMGGNRVVQWRWYYNLFVVFLVSGLWHGAAWTFVAWGALHGAYLITSIWTRPVRERLSSALRLDRKPALRRILQVGITFHLVWFAWIFFRANSLGDACILLRNMMTVSGEGFRWMIPALGAAEMSIALFAIGIMLMVQICQRNASVPAMLSARPFWIRWALYHALVLSILLFGKMGAQEFIYFQF